jgi:hypothetical protein
MTSLGSSRVWPIWDRYRCGGWGDSQGLYFPKILTSKLGLARTGGESQANKDYCRQHATKFQEGVQAREWQQYWSFEKGLGQRESGGKDFGWNGSEQKSKGRAFRTK